MSSIKGQLNEKERKIITDAVAELQPECVLEVGTWYGGGSTLHILQALEANKKGHLWGIEAYDHIYEKMIENIKSAGEELEARFTPIFGFSDKVIPGFLSESERSIGVVFLDGGDSPMEQILEFQLLQDAVPVGGVVLSHDAKLRKGKWLVPYLTQFDNWKVTLHDISDEGLFEARKIAEAPSSESKARAAKTLAALRREPVEWIGRNIPRPLLSLIIKTFPTKLVHRFGQGRK